MFSKTKEPEVPQTPQTGAPKRAPRNGGVPSIISADVTVRGTLVSMGDVQIDGKIDGDVRARYWADKHAAFPPDVERQPGARYTFRV